MIHEPLFQALPLMEVEQPAIMPGCTEPARRSLQYVANHVVGQVLENLI